MGDITGRPKAPAQQVVYVPQYVYETPAAGSGGEDGGGKDSPSVAEQREKNLLSRGRSRLGTVLTSFRGILAPKETDAQRKTLLGE